MNALFIILFLACLVALVAGLIKPSIYSRFIKSGLSRKRVLLIFGIGTIATFILVAVTTPSPAGKVKEKQETQAPAVTSSPKPQQVSGLGKEAFLRLPDNTDPKQKIPLAPTKEVAGQVTKTLIAKDWQGLLEQMTSQGVFAVPVGTKVLLIDSAIAYRKVRVLEGEMQGKAGWLPMEWVVDR